MDKSTPKSASKQKSRESSFVKSGQESAQSSRPISRERPKRNNGSRRNSVNVLSMLPKTPPGSRRYSYTPDKEKVEGEQLRRNGESASDERGADVASKATSKVSKFLDYYNEALRRRLERELLKPVKVIVNEESEHDTEDDVSDNETRGRGASIWTRAVKKSAMVSKIADAALPKKNLMGSQALTQINKKKAVKQIQMLLRRVEVRRRFKKKTRIIIFCIRCVKDHSFKFRENSELTPYMNTLNYIDYKNDQVKDLMFDRSQFSANRQMRISEETKRILCKRKSARTDNEVYSALIALRNIRSFAELPVRMQQMIAAAGQYESFEGKRVITREGHPSAAFYFILSGAAVAMKMDPERPNIASAVKEYVKGDNFEENPMINDTVREVTVLTKEPCEFLSISAADYKNIFMQGGVKNLNDPDQELFLKNLHFLHGWPIHLLQDHPKECRFHYFKGGYVLTEDTKKSPWLFIVKSGSLRVMKKLKKVGPFEWRKNSGIKPLTEKETRERLHERKQWRRYVLPELRINLQGQSEFEEIAERVDGKPKPFEHPDIKVHMEGSGSLDGKNQKYYYPNLWSYSSANEEEDKSAFSNINKQFLYTISSHTARGPKKKPPSAVVKPPATAPDLQQIRRLSETRSVPSPGSDVSDVSLRMILTSPNGSEETARTPTSVFDERLKTIAAEVRNGGEPLTEVDLNPQFVHITTLIKGDVWGIADVLIEDQPSMIIVSNGADCVLISKHFYKQHCPEKLHRQLKHNICPYPSDDNLQDSLQLSVDWNEHKRCELSGIVKRVREQRILRETTFPTKLLKCVK